MAGWARGRSPAPASLPSKQQQIKVLAGVLKKMHKNYAKYARITPGPQDVFDYGIGSLWLKGIDGAGTTIAVMEGWKDPNVGKVVAGFDKMFGLPNPRITTIFPAGPLPKKCPPGMVALGSYGSCKAWAGELELDVISAHLMAPYAKIVISATPADTQETDDAARGRPQPRPGTAGLGCRARRAARSLPHVDGYSAVLIQLKYVFQAALREAITDGWLACAPARLVDQYLGR